MNRIPLKTPDGNVAAFMCEVCEAVYTHGFCAETAEACCRCAYCNEPIDRLKHPHAVSHFDCQEEDRKNRGKKRLESAAEVEGYSGWLHVEGCSHNEGFFSSMDDLMDWFSVGNRIQPEWAFCCSEHSNKASADMVVIAVCDDGYEGMEDNLSGIDELRLAIDQFNETNKDALRVYEVDYGRKVRIPLVARSVGQNQ